MFKRIFPLFTPMRLANYIMGHPSTVLARVPAPPLFYPMSKFKGVRCWHERLRDFHFTPDHAVNRCASKSFEASVGSLLNREAIFDQRGNVSHLISMPNVCGPLEAPLSKCRLSISITQLLLVKPAGLCCMKSNH